MLASTAAVDRDLQSVHVVGGGWLDAVLVSFFAKLTSGGGAEVADRLGDEGVEAVVNLVGRQWNQSVGGGTAALGWR
jgi:hypothetical protein